MESVLGVTNRIQTACTVLGDYGGVDNALPTLWNALPTIVAVGGQSSWKSWCWRALLGVIFYPGDQRS